MSFQPSNHDLGATMASETDTELAPPWGKHALPDDAEPWSHRLGPLVLWVRTRPDEIWESHSPGDWIRTREEPPEEPPRDDERWTRWPVTERPRTVVLSPVFPSRSLVVKPENSFRLLPDSQARIYVRVPLSARLSISAPQERGLTEIPTVELSDTWWGEFTEGEVCYWLSTTARREVTPEVVGPHQAVCALDLSNRSREELEVQRIALRVEHLSLFRGRHGFWSDLTRVRYRGDQEGSQIDVTGRPPQEAGETARVTEARTPVTKRFQARTFSRLKSLSGWGGV